MTIKEMRELYKDLYTGLEKRISSLEQQVVNHCGQHTWDRIVGYLQLTLMIVVILLLKFKIL